MEKFKDIIEKVEKLTVVELAELIKALEEKFGVSASMPMATGMAGAGAVGIELLLMSFLNQPANRK